jgi:transposase-like protein
MPTAPAYTEEFRRQAVDLITSEKRYIAHAARRLGGDAKTLRKWVPKYWPATAATPSPSVERELRSYGGCGRRTAN